MEISWSQGSLEDLRGIFDFIARDSPTYADRMVDRIYDAASRVGQYPDIGRQIPEFSEPRFREVIVGAYRLMYARDPDLLRIITILHSSRDVLTNVEPSDFR